MTYQTGSFVFPTLILPLSFSFLDTKVGLWLKLCKRKMLSVLFGSISVSLFSIMMKKPVLNFFYHVLNNISANHPAVVTSHSANQLDVKKKSSFDVSNKLLSFSIPNFSTLLAFVFHITKMSICLQLSKSKTTVVSYQLISVSFFKNFPLTQLFYQS